MPMIIIVTIAIEKGKYMDFEAFEYYNEYAYWDMHRVVFRFLT